MPSIETATQPPRVEASLPNALLELGVGWTVPAGRIILEAGFRSDVCFALISGALQVTIAPGRRTRSQVVALLGPGEWVGLESLYKGESAFQAETIATSRLLAVRKLSLLKLLDSDAAARAALFAAMLEAQQAVATRLHGLCSLGAEQRVNWILETLGDKFAVPCGQRSRRLTVQLTQTQLATLAATSRQKVNHVIARLKAQRLLSFLSGEYVLHW